MFEIQVYECQMSERQVHDCQMSERNCNEHMMKLGKKGVQSLHNSFIHNRLGLMYM